MGQLEAPGPVRNDSAQVVTHRQGDQCHRDQGGPHKQADAVKGSDDAGAQNLDHHDGGTGHEYDRIEKCPIKSAGRCADGSGSGPGSCISPALFTHGWAHLSRENREEQEVGLRPRFARSRSTFQVPRFRKCGSRRQKKSRIQYPE